MNSRICLVLVLLASLGFTLAPSDLGAQCTPSSPAQDCNSNGVLDSCDLTLGVSDDCNLNGLPDECDIAAGTSEDCNLDGIPDECEPVGEKILLAPADAAEFGHAVDIEGGLALIGDPAYDQGETLPLNTGAAYVYRQVGTKWVLEAPLVPIDPAEGLLFGSSVAIHGDVAVVGAPGSGSVLDPARGAVYVFRKLGSNWVQQAKLTAADGATFDNLGTSVDAGDDLIVAGAPGNDNGGVGSGSVYVFADNGGTWLQTAKLAPAIPVSNAKFGTSISLADGYLAVGAPRDDQGATSQAGSVYTYRQVAGNWSFLQKLASPAPDSGDKFGRSAVLSADAETLLVGAPEDNGSEGAAFVYTRSTLTFTYSNALFPLGGTGNNDMFGQAVGIAGDHMIVTANRAGGNIGQAHVFDGTGAQVQLLLGSGTSSGSHFGFSAAAEGLFALVGAPNDNRVYAYQIVPFPDCNDNGLDDVCEITTGLAEDCNLNGQPDDCDIAEGLSSDCNLNGIPDSCELADGSEFDCNLNGVLDVCDIAAGASDCNLNGIPDECETDCNGNSIPDDCDLVAGTSLDCNENDIPDECDIAFGFAQDCNGNGIPDSCDIATGTSLDCNANAIPDECDIAAGTAPDCNLNGKIDSCDIDEGLSTDCNLTGVPDECEIASGLSDDCNLNGTPDECELSAGTAFDCNGNSILDECDIAAGTSQDCNANAIPDECDTASGASLDCNTNQVPDECEVNPDPIFPTIDGVPGDMTLTAEPATCQAIVSWPAPTATDNCGIASFSGSDAPGSSFPVGSTLVTYTAIDVSGNQTTASFTITVTDDEAPVILQQLPDLALDSEPGLCGAAATWTTPTASDNCGIQSLTADAASGDTFPVGQTVVTYTATDIHGNSTPMSFTVTVTDIEAPALAGVPTGATQTNDAGQCGAVVTWADPTATDNCDVASITSTHAPGDFFAVGDTLVTYTATDIHGNSSSESFTVTITDDELPVINALPADITVDNDAGDCGALVSWTEPTASDNCANDTLGSDLANGSFFAVGTTTVTYTATDIHGNSASASFTVTVNDNEAPTLADLPADLTLANDAGQCGAVATWAAPTAADNCQVDTLTADFASGDLFPVGSTTVTYTATDIHGNSAQIAFTITVEDTELPLIVDLPADITQANDLGQCAAVVTWTPATATDNCAVATLESTHAPGDVFPVGATTVTVTATDIHGNVATASFTVTVEDTEAPAIADTPADITLTNDAGQCGAIASWAAPTASDNCAVDTLVADAASGDFFPVGSTVVTYTATDIHGNSSSTSFTVTVTDDEVPTFADVPATLTLTNDAGQCGAIASWNAPSAADNCAVDTLTSDFASGDFFPVGTTAVTYTATDIHGNSASVSFDVVVEDAELPLINDLPADLTINNDPGQCAAVAVWAEASATDNCQVDTLTSDFAPGDTFPVGDTLVTYTATDIHGNSASASFTVTVLDVDAPQIVDLPANFSITNDAGQCSAVATWASPSATDNCAVDTLTSDFAAGDVFPVGDTLVTYTATDIHGNSASASFTVTVTDDELPAIVDLPADIALTNDAGQCGAIATWIAPTATDNCAVDTLLADAASGDFFPVGDTVVTYTATDIHGNAFSASFTVTVTDDEAPSLADVPADLTITNDEGQCGAIASWASPTAADNCAVDTLVTDVAPGTFLPVGDTLVTYTATDIHGNSASASFTVTVLDEEAPAVVDLPADIALTNDAGECGAIATWLEPSATDNCAVDTLTSDLASGAFFAVGETVVTYTATDIHGNSSSASFTVTVTDDEVPAIVDLPADFSITNDEGQCGAIATWIAPTATDNCAVDTLLADAASGDFFPVGDTLVTYTATDIHGNAFSASFTVTVTDDEAPSLADVPADLTITNDEGQCGAIASWLAPTAADNCAVDTLTADFAAGDFFPVGDTLVTYTATDIHGNSASASFTVTVLDEEAPAVVDLPADIALTNDAGECGAIATWLEPSATDNCAVDTLTSDLASGAFFAVGETVVTYTATDIHGNSSSASFTVTVTDDEVPAIVDLPADFSITNDEGQCGAIATWIAPTATDNCAVDTLLADAASGDFFPVGDTVVTYTATDIHGNAFSAAFTVTVTDDEAPSLADVPADLTITNDEGQCGAIASWASPTAADNCAVDTLTADFAAGDFFPVGDTLVTYTATDIHGNSASASFTVTVLDEEVPAIVDLPADFSITNDEGQCGAVASWLAPSATDNCAVDTLTSDFASGDVFPVGDTLVTYTATDIHGNSSSASFTVTVTDDEVPAIVDLPADFSITNDEGQCGAIATWIAPTATDNCAVDTLLADAASGDFFPVGDTVVTYTATDIHGNAFSASFTVTVTDDEAPSLADVPADLTITNDEGQCGAIASWTSPTAADNCAVDTLVTDVAPGTFLPVGDTLVTYTATDIHGNSASASFTVTVLDEEAPSAAAITIATEDLSADAGECSISLIAFVAESAGDNCDVAGIELSSTTLPQGALSSTTITPTSWGLSAALVPVGAHDLTVTVIDIHGNTADSTVIFTVVDTQAPQIVDLPANLELTNDAGLCGAVATWAAPSATDNCAVDTLTADAASGDTFPVGETVVTYTATDIHGNSSSASFTITVLDTEVPQIVDLPANIEITNDEGQCGAIASWIAPSATDNCAVDTLLADAAAGDFFPVGDTLVTYTATDIHGNSASESFTVTVLDTENPVIVDLPADIEVTNDLGLCAAVVEWTLPSATDNCAIELLSSDHQSGDSFPVGDTLVTYTTFDIHGNMATASFTITVLDTELPAIADLPADIELTNDAGQCGAVATWTEPSATDNCAVDTLLADAASGDFFPVGSTAVTYTATDIHGNAISGSFNVTVTDTEAPTFADVPADLLLTNDAGQCGAIATWTAPTSADNCAIDTLTADAAPGDFFPVGTTLVTYMTTDIHGNSASASFTVTVTDDEQPTIVDLPADITLTNDAGLCGAVATWIEPSATDNCAVDTLLADAASGDLFPVGDTVVTYTATDIHGNAISGSFTVTVTDDEQPAILDLPADLELTNDEGQCGAVATWAEPSATDNCAVDTLLADAASGDFFPVGSTAVTYTATDIHGNAFSATFTVTVADTEAPTFADVPADLLLTNDAEQCGAIATWTAPTSADNCAIDTLTADAAPGDFFPVGTTLVTYMTTDIHGNSASASFTVTVTDDEQPTIVDLPADITLTNDAGLCGAVATWIEPSATDNCAVDTLLADAASGDLFPVGDTVVTYTATDIHGNAISGSFTVTVTDDEQPEILDLPADLLLENDLDACGAVASWLPPGAADNCGVAMITSASAPGDFFPVGASTVTYTATDIHGNELSASFTVTVEDTQAPAIVDLPADIEITNDLGACGAIATWTEPTSTDNCAIESLASSHASGDFFPVGSTTVTYTTFDIHGNSGHASFTVTVLDTEAPAIVDLPADIELTNDEGQCGAVATWTEPTSTDNCAIETLTADAASGDFFPVGQTLVTYTTTDIHGNSTSASFTVTVLDTEAPQVVDLPADIELTNDEGVCGAVATWIEPSSVDNCAIDTLTADAASGDLFPVGTTVVTYSTTDIHGNSASASFTVTVTDTEAPIFTAVPADVTLTNDPGICGAAHGFQLAQATDNCAIATIAVSGLPVPEGQNTPVPAGIAGLNPVFPVGSTTVTFTATDIHGNSTDASFTVTVLDEEQPEITDLPEDITVENDLGACGAAVEWTAAGAIDNCDVDSLVADAASGDFFPVGTTVVTYTATDIHGNSSSASFSITILDTEVPSIAGLPADMTLTNDAGACGAIVDWIAPTAADNCEVEFFLSDRLPGEFFAVGTETVTYTATDIHGNEFSASFTVTVTDDELPTISGLPADLSLTNDEGACGAVVTWTAPLAADNCQVDTLTSTALPGDFFPVGDTLVTYTATDIHGNAFSAGFTVTVADTEAPAIVDLSGDLLLSSDEGECGAIATWLEPGATDNCAVDSLTSDHASGEFFPVGSTVVTYTVLDIHGNSSSESFTVTVEDTEQPSLLGVPADMVLTNDFGQCSAIVSWDEVTASDNCAVAGITSDHASGDAFPVGTTLVTFVATDIHGNASNQSFTITVLDEQLPSLTGVPADLVLTNDAGQCGAVATWAAPNGTDNCAVATFVSTHESGDFFETGTTEVTYTLTDIHGNTVSDSFTVTVTDDELPTITDVPADMVVEAEEGLCSAAVNWLAPTAADNCEVSEFVSNHASGKTFLLGTHEVLYTATDSSGNVSSASFTITIIDTQAPELVSVPADMVMPSQGGQCGKPVAWAAPSATDNCDVDTITSTHQPGDFFPVGDTVVTYTVTDPSGNSSSASFTVTIEDTELPVIVVGADITMPAEEAVCFANVTVPVPTAGDNCGVASLTNDVTGTDDASAIYERGTTTITWTLTDIHGNVTNATQLVTITVDETDCNGNGTPDVCDLASGTSIDCNSNGIPDECEVDCNENGIPDDCDIANETSLDTNSNGIPDECEPVFVRGDANGNGGVEFVDAIFLLQYLTGSNVAPGCLDAADTNDDNALNLVDPIYLLRHLFLNESPPPAPHQTCGIDGDGISLGCDVYNGCP